VVTQLRNAAQKRSLEKRSSETQLRKRSSETQLKSAAQKRSSIEKAAQKVEHSWAKHDEIDMSTTQSTTQSTTKQSKSIIVVAVGVVGVVVVGGVAVL
jgi:hypothetical protein